MFAGRIGVYMTPRILFVDDEPNILEAFRRQLRGRYHLDLATSGAAALEHIAQGPAYHVIVSDMRMPAMDGIELLHTVREAAPGTVRIMLTGNADRDTAVRAINEGHVFRYLTKPCSSQQVESIIQEAVLQCETQRAEQALLQNTLSGAIKVLTDILSMVDPDTFGQGVRLRSIVRELATGLKISNGWEVELAAMLGDIGTVTLPRALVAKVRSQQVLAAKEAAVVERVPEIGRQLIANIPRLERIAEMVGLQHRNFDGSGLPADAPAGAELPEGARILKIARALLQSESEGKSRSEAIRELRAKGGSFDPDLLSKLSELHAPAAASVDADRFSITVKELVPGQIILDDLKTTDGRLLVRKGSTVTDVMVRQIVNYASLVGLSGAIIVNARIPT